MRRPPAAQGICFGDPRPAEDRLEIAPAACTTPENEGSLGCCHLSPQWFNEFPVMGILILFSPVPFFLCCRAIELEIKSKHLEEKRQQLVKKDLGHDIVKAYDTLDEKYKILNEDEYLLLKKTSEVYLSKAFEYINVGDAGTAFKRFPDLEALDA